MRAFLVAVLLVAAACGGGDERAEGVVVAVDGGFSGVASFEIVTRDGDRLRFEPAEDLDSFDDGAALSHLNEHLQTGSPIRVTYRSQGDVLLALAVADA